MINSKSKENHTKSELFKKIFDPKTVKNYQLTSYKQKIQEKLEQAQNLKGILAEYQNDLKSQIQKVNKI